MRRSVIGFCAVIAVSACSSDPLSNFPRLGDVPAAGAATSVAQTPAETQNTGGGLFGRLLNRTPDDPTNAAVEAALADAGVVVDQGVEPVAVTPEADIPPSPRRGLFGLFGGNRNTATPSETEAATIAATETTSSDVERPVAEEPEQPRPRFGLGNLLRPRQDAGDPPRNGPDAQDVPAGSMMPFGQIARVCGMRTRDMGREVANRGGFKIYDTIPNSTAARPFYITGFDDNCARTFSGAVVIPGDIETHEFVRYQSSNAQIAYTETDNAYEALKASVCRVGRGQPCGDRSDRFNRNTQFITVYDFFGGTFSAVPTEWAQILIHDGRVVAMSIKDG